MEILEITRNKGNKKDCDQRKKNVCSHVIWDEESCEVDETIHNVVLVDEVNEHYMSVTGTLLLIYNFYF